MPYTVTLIPGDGTGPELAEATRRVIDATGVKIDWEIAHAGVQVLGVLAHDHNIHAFIARAHAGIALARAHASVEVERLAQGHVHAAETGTDGGGDGRLQGHAVLAHGLDGLVRQRRAE